MRTLAILVVAVFATAVCAGEADDKAIAALKAALKPQCECGILCLCPNCDCTKAIMASPPMEFPPVVTGAVYVEHIDQSQAVVQQALQVIQRSSYAALKNKSMVNGQTIVVAVGCKAPEGSYVSVQADERDGLRPGHYVVAGRWYDGAIYVDRYFPTDVDQSEIRKAIEQPAPVQQPQIQYIQQPQQQVMYGGGYSMPMQSSFGFGGGFSGGGMRMGGGSCGPGGCR